MNKILNINLGGFPFTIDDDAYQFLAEYIESIRTRFNSSEGRDEIINDIEMRLGELIQQKMGTRSIVMLPDVQATVEIMGSPSDFGGEDPSPKPKNNHPAGNKTKRRLFRDEEDAVLGGVSSGLATYLGIEDPLWVRLPFACLVFLSFGFWIPVYFLLWIIVPAAKNAADRLAMRGEPANINSIAKEIETGFDRLGNKVQEVEQNMKSGSATFHSATNSNSVGNAVRTLIKIIVKAILIFASLLGGVVFLALFFAWVGGVLGMVAIEPYLPFFSPVSLEKTHLLFTNFFLLLLLPLFSLALLFVRLLLHKKLPAWINPTILLLWVLNLASAVWVGAAAVRELRLSGHSTSTINLSNISSDTLRLQSANPNLPYQSFDDFFILNNNYLHDGKLTIPALSKILVKPATGSKFEAATFTTARASSQYEAEKMAAAANITLRNQENALIIDPNIVLNPNEKWNFRQTSITLMVPIGKYFSLDDPLHALARSVQYANEKDKPLLRNNPNRVYRMTANGIACTDCPIETDPDF
jgi:phage shock protein PspC (stress-responsive transcriptional regulator)